MEIQEVQNAAVRIGQGRHWAWKAAEGAGKDVLERKIC